MLIAYFVLSRLVRRGLYPYIFLLYLPLHAFRSKYLFLHDLHKKYSVGIKFPSVISRYGLPSRMRAGD